jgi:hypothetical protein
MKENVKNTLYNLALNSPITHKHAAAVTISNKIVSTGYNTIKGIHTIHAEANAIANFLINRGYLGLVNQCRLLWREKGVQHEYKGHKQSPKDLSQH